MTPRKLKEAYLGPPVHFTVCVLRAAAGEGGRKGMQAGACSRRGSGKTHHHTHADHPPLCPPPLHSRASSLPTHLLRSYLFFGRRGSGKTTIRLQMEEGYRL